VKRSLLAILALSIATISTYAAFTYLQSPKTTHYCFDSIDGGIRVTQREECNSHLLDLGTGAITRSGSADGRAHQLNPLLQNRFTAVQLVAKRAGIALRITSGFRTYAKQADLFMREVVLRGSETVAAHWVLPPRLSRHTQGLAIDIASANGSSDMNWLQVHAPAFGLCRTFKNERWHYEGVIAPGERCPAMAANALEGISDSAPIS
jgi:hypothetical protein